MKPRFSIRKLHFNREYSWIVTLHANVVYQARFRTFDDAVSHVQTSIAVGFFVGYRRDRYDYYRGIQWVEKR